MASSSRRRSFLDDDSTLSDCNFGPPVFASSSSKYDRPDNNNDDKKAKEEPTRYSPQMMSQKDTRGGTTSTVYSLSSSSSSSDDDDESIDRTVAMSPEPVVDDESSESKLTIQGGTINMEEATTSDDESLTMEDSGMDTKETRESSTMNTNSKITLHQPKSPPLLAAAAAAATCSVEIPTTIVTTTKKPAPSTNNADRSNNLRHSIERGRRKQVITSRGGDGATTTIKKSLIQEEQYSKLEVLFDLLDDNFLSEDFVRPISESYPDLMDRYNEIIDNPMDLSTVRGSIKHKEYRTIHQIRSDVNLIFENCKKFNSNNNDTTYVAVGFHMQEFFDCLWQEHMMGSNDVSDGGDDHDDRLCNICDRSGTMLSCRGCEGAFHSYCHIPSLEEIPYGGWECLECSSLRSRTQDRKNRLDLSGSFIMKGKYLKEALRSLRSFIGNQGRVDVLDIEPIWGDNAMRMRDNDYLKTVFISLKGLERKLTEKIQSNSELTVSKFDVLVRNCCQAVGNGRREENQNMDHALSKKIADRLDRYIAQMIVPIYELRRRGSEYSSIWARLESKSLVSARSSSTKPYWSALLLGILHEGKCNAMMKNHTTRLPPDVRTEILRNQTEKANKNRRGGKYYLVEILGSHEFGLYSETNCLFMDDPADNPNTKNKKKKKKPRIKHHCVDAKKEVECISKEILSRRGEEEVEQHGPTSDRNRKRKAEQEPAPRPPDASPSRLAAAATATTTKNKYTISSRYSDGFVLVCPKGSECYEPYMNGCDGFGHRGYECRLRDNDKISFKWNEVVGFQTIQDVNNNPDRYVIDLERSTLPTTEEEIEGEGSDDGDDLLLYRNITNHPMWKHFKEHINVCYPIADERPTLFKYKNDTNRTTGHCSCSNCPGYHPINTKIPSMVVQLKPPENKIPKVPSRRNRSRKEQLRANIRTTPSTKTTGQGQGQGQRPQQQEQQR